MLHRYAARATSAVDPQKRLALREMFAFDQYGFRTLDNIPRLQTFLQILHLFPQLFPFLKSCPREVKRWCKQFLFDWFH